MLFATAAAKRATSEATIPRSLSERGTERLASLAALVRAARAFATLQAQTRTPYIAMVTAMTAKVNSDRESASP